MLQELIDQEIEASPALLIFRIHYKLSILTHIYIQSPDVCWAGILGNGIGSSFQ